MHRGMYVKIAYIMLTASIFLSGCASTTAAPVVQDTSDDTGFVVTKAGTYDSSDENAIIKDINKDNGTITFTNHELNRNYTLKYDGASKFFDRYGSSMSVDQMEQGEIVNITFLKNKKLLNSVKLAEDAWEIDDVREFEISSQNHFLRMAGGSYVFDDSIFVYADARDAELMDINPVDTLLVRGVDREVYSIKVDRGHGYLRLKNYEYFIGGWIEIGSKIIRTIGEDMLLAVPVGKYDVLISHKGVEGTKSVDIKANKEVELDIGDLKTEELITYGKVIFVTTPSDAEVFIDGTQIDTSIPQEIEYGIHQLIARAAGYQTLTQYIKVGQENATLDVTLEKSADSSSEEGGIASPSPGVSPVPTAGIPTQPVTTGDGYKIHINSPQNVEVYFDGIYVGMSPVSITKTPGTHEITLRKDGYITRSYTVEVDNSSQDENYSFSELAYPGNVKESERLGEPASTESEESEESDD